MKNNNSHKQVSLAGAARNQGSGQKKKKTSRKKVFWLVLLVVVVLAVGGTMLYNQLTKGPSLTAREIIEYDVTPDAISGKVAYFALGVTGEESTDRMDMVAVLCLDRKADTASVVQLPVATYLGKDTGFATSTLGDVWGKPQPVTWCDTCRRSVPQEEAEGGKHTVCGTKLTSRTGSAFGDLCRVFNDQYGLPIDNFLVIPRAGLIQLVDAVGGVDLKLEKKMKVAGTTYEPGVRLLTGEAAVYYATQFEYKNTPATDRERMQRQRQLFSALLERLARYKASELYYVDKNTGSTSGPIGRLMNGTDPVRFDTSSFGKARLAACSEGTAENMKTSKAMAEFVAEICDIPQDKITFSILPGESVKSGTATVYSVNRAQTIQLLNEQMNPYALTLDENTVTVPQLKEKPTQADASSTTLDKVSVSQGTTTTTAAGGAQ